MRSFCVIRIFASQNRAPPPATGHFPSAAAYFCRYFHFRLSATQFEAIVIPVLNVTTSTQTGPQNGIPPSGESWKNFPLRGLHALCLVAFLVCAAACLAPLLSLPALLPARWALAALLVLGAATTLLNLSRSLPAQNIFAAAVLIMGLSSLAQLFGSKAGCFVAPFTYLDPSAAKTFQPLLTPLGWLVAILSSRGLARLLLRPWRPNPNYGLWAIAVTCALVFVLDACLDLADWHNDDWLATAACIITTIAIVVLAVPWLINKRPGAQPPPDWQPFIVWQTFNLLLGFAEAFHHALTAAALHFIASGIVLALAWLTKSSRSAALAPSPS